MPARSRPSTEVSIIAQSVVLACSLSITLASLGLELHFLRPSTGGTLTGISTRPRCAARATSM
jgi:hypothetical protein